MYRQQNLSLFFLFDYLVAYIINRDIVRSTIIPELSGWLQLFSRLILSILYSDLLDFSIAVFFLLSQGSFNKPFVELLKIRPVFVLYNFVCG